MRDYTDDFDAPQYRIDLTEHFAEIEQQAMGRAADRYAERMEKELLGAWRAGYDYVHVYQEPATHSLALDSLTEMATMSYIVLPSHGEVPLDIPDFNYAYTYDLTEVPDHVIRAAMKGELEDCERINTEPDW